MTDSRTANNENAPSLPERYTRAVEKVVNFLTKKCHLADTFVTLQQLFLTYLRTHLSLLGILTILYAMKIFSIGIMIA